MIRKITTEEAVRLASFLGLKGLVAGFQAGTATKARLIGRLNEMNGKDYKYVVILHDELMCTAQSEEAQEALLLDTEETGMIRHVLMGGTLELHETEA